MEFYFIFMVLILLNRADPEGALGVKTPSGKSQVAKGFLRKSGTDTPREAIGPLVWTPRSNCFSKEVSTAPVKYVHDLKICQDPPDVIF